MAASSKSHRLLLLMDHSLDIVELIGRDGAIEDISSAITGLAGYSPDELIGRHYQELIHPEDREAAEAAFAEVMKRGRAGPLTLRYRAKDGSWRTIQVAAHNYLKEPSVGAVLVITRDMTDELRLHSMLKEANAQLRGLSQQLTAARESERTRMARELHDDVGQVLIGLSLNMSAEQARFQAAGMAGRLESWKQLVSETLRHLRRAILDLRPPLLEQHGLAEELKHHVERFRSVVERDVVLETDASLGRFSPDLEICAFRIVQQALTNAVEHSGARRIVIAVHAQQGALRISVRDDGRGFDPAALSAPDTGYHMGLTSMRERAAQLGGSVTITSAPGRGTEVLATLPLPSK